MVGSVLHVADVTDRHLMEERMRRMERFIGLGLLAAGLHHEIKNPLSPSRFTFSCWKNAGKDATIPRLPKASESCGPRSIVSRATSGIRVLVIDDEPNIRTGLSKGLAGEAEIVDTAKDGEEGLLRFDASPHEIVITDVRLPGSIDGLEVVRQVKDKRPETLVIVITAFGTVEAAVEAMRRGAFDFITKPLDLNVIRHQVRGVGTPAVGSREPLCCGERLLERRVKTSISLVTRRLSGVSSDRFGRWRIPPRRV